ncbi:hypothetical protein DM860_013755 [Cuscuta australis]|uniref:Uncharacterized protein n=1 Tax=Cuscuta australis TaxID=267555 RepID=A0A328DM01_9ASTE|nr:hypothetical protein DM860_013755 [Cuscuta australis]
MGKKWRKGSLLLTSSIASNYITITYIKGDIKRRLKSIIRSPTAQIHDGSQRLLGALQLLISQLGGDDSGGRRQPGGVLGVGPEVGFGMLVEQSESVVPSGEALVLQSLHRPHARRHDPPSAAAASEAHSSSFLLTLY